MSLDPSPETLALFDYGRGLPSTLDRRTAALYEAGKKSVLLSYILWFFLGWISAHRLYNGRYVTALMQIGLTGLGGVLAHIGVGFLFLIPAAIWWFIDALLIPGWVRRRNMMLAWSLSRR